MKFFVRFSNRTFEHVPGRRNFVDSGGCPEQIKPLEEADFGLFLFYAGAICDENGEIIGCKLKDHDGTYHEIYPGKVYNIDVWNDCVDDDGCPESVCISYYIELIPRSE